MEPIVLIVAPEDDAHALVIKHMLDEAYNTEAVIWDVSQLSNEDYLSFSPIMPADDYSLTISGRKFDRENLQSIWWRRPNISEISKKINDQKIRKFCSREYTELIIGSIANLDVPIINNPHTESQANHKAYQLSVAQQCSLNIPNTLISNDPNRVEYFWLVNNKDCIYKTLSPIPDQFRETRKLMEEDIPHLNLLHHAPIIVQEMIEGRDIRVNMFGDDFFSAVVKSSIPEAKGDWRIDPNCIWEPFECNIKIQTQLRTFLDEIGLQYGCIDMRVQPDGRYVFLEVNPSGQFLFIEVDTKETLAKSFAHMLVQPTQK